MVEVALALPVVLIAATMAMALIVHSTETMRVSADINQAQFELEAGWAGPDGIGQERLAEVLEAQIANTTGLDEDRLTVWHASLEPADTELTPESEQGIDARDVGDPGRSVYQRQVTTVERTVLHFNVRYEFEPILGEFELFGNTISFAPEPYVRSVTREVLLSRAADLWGGAS